VALIGSGYRFLAYALLIVYVVPLLTIGLRRLVLGARRGIPGPAPLEPGRGAA
jgi:hypothetical protein